MFRYPHHNNSNLHTEISKGLPEKIRFFFSHLKFFLMNILHQFPHDHLCIITKHFVHHAVNLLTQWHHILKHISRMKLALSTE